MADRLPQATVMFLLDHSCAVCHEHIAGPTTKAAAASGLKFEEIFFQAKPTYSRAWNANVLSYVHRCHLN
jgi:hypothetical protein